MQRPLSSGPLRPKDQHGGDAEIHGVALRFSAHPLCTFVQAVTLSHTEETQRLTDKAAEGGVMSDGTELNELTEQIIGAAIEVHRHLGPGLLESAYE